MKKLSLLIGTSIILLISTTAFAQANEPGSGNCLKFNGVSDCVEKQSPGNLNIGWQSWSVSVWIKTTTTSTDIIVARYECGWSCLIGGGPDAALYVLSVLPPGLVAFRVRDDNSQSFTVNSINAVNDGSWHYVSGILNRGNNTLKIYIDGVEENSISVAGITSINDAGSPLEIGRLFVQGFGSPMLYFNGQIDEIRIWNYARSQTEIREDLCKKLSGSEPGLVGYWRMDEGSGSTAFDSSPNTNDGTLY